MALTALRCWYIKHLRVIARQYENGIGSSLKSDSKTRTETVQDATAKGNSCSHIGFFSLESDSLHKPKYSLHPFLEPYHWLPFHYE